MLRKICLAASMVLIMPNLVAAKDFGWTPPATSQQAHDAVCKRLSFKFTLNITPSVYMAAGNSHEILLANTYSSWMANGCDPKMVTAFEACILGVTGHTAVGLEFNEMDEINYCTAAAAKTLKVWAKAEDFLNK